MSSPDDSGPSPSHASRGDSRQLALVALCVLGLVVAAFALPALSGARSPADGGAATTTTTPDAGQDGADGEFTVGTPDGRGEGGDGGVGDGGGGDATAVRKLVLGDGSQSAECVVAVEGRQVPGATVTVHVWRDGRPAPDHDVWFDGRYVGATDARGQVTGRVPYTRELRVNVSLPDEQSCRFVYAREVETTRSVAAPSGASLPDSTTDLLGGAFDGRPGSLLQSGDGNHSGTVPVNGAVNVSVRGEPLPGETVTVVAGVEGVPMRDAAVAVDGERVGRTDATGRYELRIPDDGTERLTVAVARGDFSGSTTVRVQRLAVAVVPSSLLPVPGTRAAVRATAAGEPVAGAAVTVDGRRLGTTDGDGRVRFRLPADPGATVRVRADGRTATTTLWPAYAPTFLAVGLAGLALVGSAAVAYRRRGIRGLGHVAAAWFAVAAVISALAVAGRTGGLVALALVALAGVAVLLRRRRDAVAGGARTLAAAVAALVEWLLGRALRVTDALAALAVRARAALDDLRPWLASLPRSASALLGRAAARLRNLPGRVGAALSGRLDGRTVAAAALAVAVVAAATAVGGARGFLAALGLVVVGVVAVTIRRRPDDDVGPTTADGPGDDSRDDAGPTTEGRDDAASRQSLRERWRTFARWVAPTGWRRRTPGEVSREAVERGFPREPVAEFTRLFREVEYGDRPLSRERRDRAEAAFDELAAARRHDEEGEEQ